MKKTLSLVFLFAIIFSACEKSTNYSAQMEQERKKIKEYVKDKKIIYNFNINDICNSETAENTYYSLGEDSIYFRINEVGDTARPVKLYDRVQIRYIETTLDGLRVEEYWTTLDLPRPPEVIFGDIPVSSTLGNGNCAGWQSAIRMMRYSGTVAEIIVPSKLGIARNFSSVTPCHYKFFFKILPK